MFLSWKMHGGHFFHFALFSSGEKEKFNCEIDRNKLHLFIYFRDISPRFRCRWENGALLEICKQIHVCSISGVRPLNVLNSTLTSVFLHSKS